jgi:hypothetical protein
MNNIFGDVGNGRGGGGGGDAAMKEEEKTDMSESLSLRTCAKIDDASYDITPMRGYVRCQGTTIITRDHHENEGSTGCYVRQCRNSLKKVDAKKLVNKKDVYMHILGVEDENSVPQGMNEEGEFHICRLHATPLPWKFVDAIWNSSDLRQVNLADIKKLISLAHHVGVDAETMSMIDRIVTYKDQNIEYILTSLVSKIRGVATDSRMKNKLESIIRDIEGDQDPRFSD